MLVPAHLCTWTKANWRLNERIMVPRAVDPSSASAADALRRTARRYWTRRSHVPKRSRRWKLALDRPDMAR